MANLEELLNLRLANFSGTQVDSTDRNVLVQSLLEAFTDGVMLLTSQGKLLHTNQRAVQLCRHLQEDFTSTFEIPKTIWRICKSLLESRDLFPNQTFVIEDETLNATNKPVRIRVQWIDLQFAEQPYLLVTLEDLSQSAAISNDVEAQQFGLTPREYEVWRLRKAKYNYKEIASELYISLKTVKKHIKNIYAKRNRILDAEDIDTGSSENMLTVSESSALILEGSEEGFRRIESLFQSGKLTEIQGIPVKNVDSPYKAVEVRQNRTS